MFARFLVVVLSRPEIDLKESISEFELPAFPRALFNSDGDLRHCVGKSKLMSILESSLPDQRPDQEEDRCQHAGKSVVIIDGMAVVQSMGKPTWVRNGRDLASHFLEIIDNRSKECDEVHIVFDRYDIPNSLKQGIRQFRQGCNRLMVYQISDGAVIEKITLKQLLSSNVNKESLAMYFASYILESRDSQKTYVVTLKSQCRSNNLSVHHLNTTQEEADTCMLLHAIDATQRGAASLCIQSPDTDVLILALWKYTSLFKETSVVAGTGAKP